DPLEPRTRRGINRIQDLPRVGKWQYMYGKFIGTRTRKLISILKKDWKQVTKEEKNFLWSDIKVPWSNERPLENKDLNAIIGAWFTLWRD
ncbi:hypothetical protein Tco_0516057, partial [Tanacetum coccineum]